MYLNVHLCAGELNVVNESGMSIVALPPTPQKDPPPSTQGLSSQILPLSRLSLSSTGNSPTGSQSSGDGGSSNGDKKVDNVSENNNGSTDGNKSPVKDKLLQLRKSFTEPLMQYFHEQIQVTPCENEEPEILNTPKSLVSASHSSSSSSSPKQGGNTSKTPRNLLPSLQKQQNGAEDDDAKDERPYENMPPIIITDM